VKVKTLPAACVLACASLAHAGPNAIRIGFITDMSGLYSDIDGPAGAEMIKQAVANFGGSIDGKKVEVLVADHQNKADVAAAKAREWFDQQGLDVLIGGTNSGAALAMASVAAEKKKPYIVVGAAAATLTNERCTPYTIHYAYDTTALAKGTGKAVVKAGGSSWYFLTADYAFGSALQNDTMKVVREAGGTVAGSTRHPLNASDFSSFLVQAQSSKAQVLGLANAGGDTINSIKAANEFGITKSMRLVGLLVFINDIHSLGLKTSQGMYVTDSWYWNETPETRAWSRKFFDRFKRMPSSLQAADYSAAWEYLNAVKAAGTDDADKVLRQLHRQKINDVFAKNGYVRDDGRMVHDMYLMQVKAPAQSSEPWDYYNVVDTIKGEAAWTSRAESRCALWK
jgi:branched-chain amino acid transport system substrate-binding protein